MLLLAVFWLVNSGHYTPLLLGLGVASVLLVVFFARRMGVIDHESQPLHLFPHVFPYWGWLVKEIVVANINVAVLIWRGSGAIQPTKLVIETASNTDVCRVIFANSVTLTPGTVTLNLSGNEVTIHALSQRSAIGLAALDRRVRKLET